MTDHQPDALSKPCTCNRRMSNICPSMIGPGPGAYCAANHPPPSTDAPQQPSRAAAVEACAKIADHLSMLAQTPNDKNSLSRCLHGVAQAILALDANQPAPSTGLEVEDA